MNEKQEDKNDLHFDQFFDPCPESIFRFLIGEHPKFQT
jgi:hypothetical protein